MGRGITSQSLPWERLRLRLSRERAGSSSGVNPGLEPRCDDASVASLPPAANALEHDVAGWSRLFGDVLETSTEPLMVVGADGAILCANAATRALEERLGLPTSPSAPLNALLDQIDVVTPGGARTGPIAAGRELKDIVQSQDWDAARPIFEARVRPRRAPNGRPSGWIVQLVEVTGLVETLRELETAKRHREDILRLLSHDMRSPQAAILATIGHPDFATAPANLRQIIERAARRSLHMVDSVVRQVRAESAEFAFESTDLGHLLEEAIDAVWSAAKSANIKVLMSPSPDAFVVSANRGMLTRALTDVLNNGIKFGLPGGEITCRLSAATLHGKPGVACEVTGRVRQASEGELIQIFSRFAASEHSEVGSMGDSGGLALLKTVVKRHAGTVACENAAEGRRKVTIILPQTAMLENVHKHAASAAN